MTETADRLSPLKLLALIAAMLFLLDLFFVSISLLGAFKDIGSGYGQDLINRLAHNPFVGLFVGIFITSIIQSSSTTTSLVVGLVAGGAFGESPAEAIAMAIPIVMGSNIGTSVTNVIVSMAHMSNPRELERAFSSAIVHDFFNIICVLIFLPLQLATNFLGHAAAFMTGAFQGVGGVKLASPLKILVSPQKGIVSGLMEHQFVVEFIVFAALMFGIFQLLNMAFRRVQKDSSAMPLYVAGALLFGAAFGAASTYREVVFHPSTATFILALALLLSSLAGFVKVMKALVLGRLEGLFHRVIFRNAAAGMGFGLLITAIVQSSSVTTSLAVPLAGAGIITIYQVFPYTLGANVGTTVTALLAALSAGEATGLTVAFSHLLFNIFGIIVVYPLRAIPIKMALKLASLAARNRLVPIVFVVLTYLVIPLIFILVTG